MGAANFSCVASGADAGEAFDNAVSEAQYDYGHAGYTGTIAEKHDFTMLTKERLPINDAVELANRLISDCDPRIDNKWGPAGCIPLTNGQYLFCGWASS